MDKGIRHSHTKLYEACEKVQIIMQYVLKLLTHEKVWVSFTYWFKQYNNPENEGATILLNIRNYSHIYTA